MICPEHIPEIINEVSVGKFHDTRCERVVKILKSPRIENIVENATSSKYSGYYWVYQGYRNIIETTVFSFF